MAAHACTQVTACTGDSEGRKQEAGERATCLCVFDLTSSFSDHYERVLSRPAKFNQCNSHQQGSCEIYIINIINISIIWSSSGVCLE